MKSCYICFEEYNQEEMKIVTVDIKNHSNFGAFARASFLGFALWSQHRRA